jgi:hypothetical protein
MGSNVILAIGALVTFSIILSSSNRMMTSNTKIAEQNEYYLSALSLGQSVIDEAKVKYFDENVAAVDQDGDALPIVYADSLSTTLGREGSAETSVPAPDTLTTASPFTAASPGYRSQDKFDDIDDYNGYVRVVNTQRAHGFRLSVKVLYASVTKPDSASSLRTFCKVMYVGVTSPYLAAVEYKPGETGYVENMGYTHPDTVKISYAFMY